MSRAPRRARRRDLSGARCLPEAHRRRPCTLSRLGSATSPRPHVLVWLRAIGRRRPHLTSRLLFAWPAQRLPSVRAASAGACAACPAAAPPKVSAVARPPLPVSDELCRAPASSDKALCLGKLVPALQTPHPLAPAHLQRRLPDMASLAVARERFRQAAGREATYQEAQANGNTHPRLASPKPTIPRLDAS